MPAHRATAYRPIETLTFEADVARKPISLPPLGDLRFRKLLGSNAWNVLPPAIRRRFSKRLGNGLGGGLAVVYVGHTTHMEMSRVGFLLAQVARVIGGPLPISRDVDVPSVVTVTEDVGTGGQIWTRLYAHRSGFPQVIHSSKRFAGPTGLEEHVGCGFGMTLKLSAGETGLTFKSERYFVQLGGVRLVLPRWLTPGQLTIDHHEIDPNRFAFTLKLEHPLFGQLIYQRAVFEESH
ncbi:MAG: hypothetical protein ACI9XZ_000751 [Alphaproteobacteria bacterium]|jgi:hypothetical protein